MLDRAQGATRWLHNAAWLATVLLLIFQAAVWAVSGDWSPTGDYILWVTSVATLSLLALRIALGIFRKMIERDV